MNFCIDFRKGRSHKPKCLFTMNLISGLMALSHHSRKLNYPGAEWESAAVSHTWILQAGLEHSRRRGDLPW